MLLLQTTLGCEGRHELNNATSEFLGVPLGTISVYQLAGRLNMAVKHNSHPLATLGDSRNNTVMIYADPDGQAFVNGKPVGSRGGIVQVGGTLFVPEKLEWAIRSALRPSSRAPAPSRTRRPAPVRPEPSRAQIVLDAGHGGKDPGATSASGLREKTIVLQTVLTIAEILKDRGCDVILTRRNDTFVELNQRAAVANRLRADFFVSVHADSHPKKSIRGSTVYVARSASKNSLTLAKTIQRHLLAVTNQTRGLRRADYRVLVKTSCPAVLVELGYVSNPSEAANLSQGPYRKRLAQ